MDLTPVHAPTYWDWHDQSIWGGNCNLGIMQSPINIEASEKSKGEGNKNNSENSNNNNNSSTINSNNISNNNTNNVIMQVLVLLYLLHLISKLIMRSKIRLLLKLKLICKKCKFTL